MIRAFANGIWFYAEPATRECQGCIFDSERSAVCRAAGEAAVAAGMPDCESAGPNASSYIYKIDLSNGRQLDLLEQAQPQDEEPKMTHPERPASKMEMQAFYTKKIAELIAEKGPQTRGQIVAALGVNPKTVIAYLSIMRENGIIRRNNFLNGRPLWELGADTKATKARQSVEDLHVRRATTPARQIGMVRDSLVAALFGPASTPTAPTQPAI